MAKEKFTLEYDMRSTPVAMLWAYIATANGLKEWFADDAKMDGKEVVLMWNGVEQGLSIVGLRTEKYIRYRWSEDNDKTYFELRITTSELTGNSLLCVTDFAEPDELQEAKDLWNYQMEALQRQLGC
ncbi:MAG: START-like domain-containing protein [Bacteroidales bacterium]|nr:START-like domain-containing protein [Bacteroidales bacterium]MDD6140402.1 START-like domain-containing protein [Bacteroidales bacterium]MDD6622355.1 START-like domain-containing protein [Bacteroidales bacterium]